MHGTSSRSASTAADFFFFFGFDLDFLFIIGSSAMEESTEKPKVKHFLSTVFSLVPARLFPNTFFILICSERYTEISTLSSKVA